MILDRKKSLKFCSFVMILSLLIGLNGLTSYANTDSETESDTSASQSKSSSSDDESIVLTAQRVPVNDPSVQKNQTSNQGIQRQKKPLPLFLQPIEFVVSSVVHAICFWKTGDELN